MSVVLVTNKRARLKIPYLRHVILGHAKSANEISQSVKHEISFVVGFSTLCCFGGGLMGTGAQGGPREVQGRPRGGGRGPRGDQGRAPGREGQGRDQGGKGPGPSEPNVTSVCLIIAAVIGLFCCCLGFLAAVIGLFGYCHWFLRPLGTLLLRTLLACHSEVYRDLKVAVSVRE